MSDDLKYYLDVAREFGAAGAVVVLAIWVIHWQGRIISKNTTVLERLSVLIGILVQRETGINTAQMHGGGHEADG